MTITTIDDPHLIEKAIKMRNSGDLISDIATKLSEENGTKITQISLCRLFNSLKKNHSGEPTELDFPSRNEIEELFSELLQKQENRICIFGGVQLRRNVMIEILNKFYKKEFTQLDVKKNLYKTTDGEVFYQHWRYLLEGNYIEQVDDYKFKFCDRGKKWKTFGQI